jgi:hypothetical protein
MKLKVHEHNKNNLKIVSKTKILLLLLMAGTICFGQQKLHFDYDVAGNQITRSWCTTCDARMAGSVKEIADLNPADLQKFNAADDFSYYPNPVKEELYLKWNPTNKYEINSIKLYNINGMLIKSFDSLNNYEQNISFQQYPNGLYILTLLYSNNEEKTIKIIKQ